MSYDHETKLRIQRTRRWEKMSHGDLADAEGIPRGSIGYILSDPNVQLSKKDIEELRQAWRDNQDDYNLGKKQFLDLMMSVYPDVPRQAIWTAVNVRTSNLPSVMDRQGVPRFEKGITDA